ncbi:hypothetical protein DFS34DRAFT_609316 [Phlyctochytrium arcticum]|nr:hypothetical protein DFS34DRAFT_609316 [Phlyctochytrium arcticum]
MGEPGRGAAKIPFLIISLFVPLLLGGFISHAPNNVADAACYCHPNAPQVINGFLQFAPTSTPVTTRVSCNYDVAVYMSDSVQNLGQRTLRWIVPFFNAAWKHVKKTYGGCRVQRGIAGPTGPNCELFGEPRPLIVQMGTETAPLSANYYYYTDRFSSYAAIGNSIWYGQASNGWSSMDWALKRRIVHAVCKIASTSSQGVRADPAAYIWQHKFADICSYDVLNKTGYAAEAKNVYDDWSTNSYANHPDGATNVNWFRDWYWPLYVDKGYTLEFHQTYFGLLSEYFPTEWENSNTNLVYSRMMDVGEYVHFLSAAVGYKLNSRAATVFNGGWNATAYAAARVAFPALNSMYTYP